MTENTIPVITSNVHRTNFQAALLDNVDERCVHGKVYLDKVFPKPVSSWCVPSKAYFGQNWPGNSSRWVGCAILLEVLYGRYMCDTCAAWRFLY